MSYRLTQARQLGFLYASDAVLSRLSAQGLEVKVAESGLWPPDEGA